MTATCYAEIIKTALVPFINHFYPEGQRLRPSTKPYLRTITIVHLVTVHACMQKRKSKGYRDGIKRRDKIGMEYE